MSTSSGGQGDGGRNTVGSPHGLGGWLDPRNIVAALLALAAIATIPFGGLNDANADDPDRGLERVAVDQVNAGTPWNVTITGGRLLKDQPPLNASVKGNRWVIILATVEITAQESRADLADMLRISGAEKLVDQKPTEIMTAGDFANYPSLHPGLPQKMVFGWEQAASAPVPTQVEVTIVGKAQRLNSFDGNSDWLDSYDRAVVTVPIVDRRNAS